MTAQDLGITMPECTPQATANLAIGLAIVLMLSAALSWTGMLHIGREASAVPGEASGKPVVMRPANSDPAVPG